MFDESQEVFCIMVILLFWVASLISPVFIIPAVLVVFYVCVHEKNDDDDTDQ